MKVLMTGASGFVGQNLLPYLSNDGHQVSSLSRADLYDSTTQMLNNFDVIIHLAGKAHDLKQLSDSSEYYEVNFELTKKLYDNFLKSTASKFIYMSSVKAVADVVSGVLEEVVVAQPATHYGKSKLMAEEHITSMSVPVDKSYYILRPCMIHGPGNKGNLNLLFKLIKYGIPYPLGAYQNKRSYLSVENLCFVINSLLKKDVPSGIFNVADNGSLSTNQVVNLLATTSCKATRIWKLPTRFVNAFAVIGNVLRLPLNTERLGKLTENYVVSNQKIRTAIGKDLPVSIKDGITHTARYFSQKHGV